MGIKEEELNASAEKILKTEGDDLLDDRSNGDLPIKDTL